MPKYKFTKTLRFNEGICIDVASGKVTPLSLGSSSQCRVAIDCPSMMVDKKNNRKSFPCPRKVQSTEKSTKHIETSDAVYHSAMPHRSNKTLRRNSEAKHHASSVKHFESLKQIKKTKKVRRSKKAYFIPLASSANPYHERYMHQQRNAKFLCNPSRHGIFGVFVPKPVNHLAAMSFQNQKREYRLVTKLRK